MLTTPWKKVLVDLWEHRGRTLIVAMAIAVGVYAVGVVLDTREIVVREYARDQQTALVPSAILSTQPFEADLSESVARLPMVTAAEGRRSVRGRVYFRSGAPQDIQLLAIPDFAAMQVEAITPLQGDYPPQRREVILERQSVDSLQTQIGQDLTIELGNEALRTLRVVGIVHDPSQFGPSMSGVAIGYVTLETMHSLGYPDNYTELLLRVTDPAHDEEHIIAAVGQVEEHLKTSGRTILSRSVITHAVADPYIKSVVMILTGFGIVILLLSGFLVVNAMSALITQQIPQIGVMKLVGARRGQIITLYLATVLVYGLIAIALALPLAALTARLLMTRVVEPMLNVMTASYSIPPHLLIIQAAVGLLLPLGAGLAPVIRGTTITTHKALNETGPSGSYKQSLVDRLLAALQKFSSFRRPLLLAIRNSLRHKGRLAQTLVVLVSGTALFICVLSARKSVNATLASFMRFHQYDISVEMEQAELIARLEPAAREVAGVAAVEVWSADAATRVRADDSKSNVFNVVAVPAGTSFMSPELIAGQWLPIAQNGAEPSVGAKGNSLVVNSDLVDVEPDVHVGSELELDMGGRKTTWRVVGVVSTESKGAAVYIDHDDYAYATRSAGRGTRVKVVGERHDSSSQRDLADRLREHLNDLGYKVSRTRTSQVTQQMNEMLFTVVVAFLILMALLLAAVGGLGLSTTMSINMMERVREVGILRAIGASNTSVRQIVLAEGVVVAALSWGAGALCSLFISPVFSEQLGVALIKIPLRYEYSAAGAVAWFFVLLGIAVAASLGPARNAVRLTVREVLAYE